MTTFWCEHAVLPGGLRRSVRVVTDRGRILDVHPDAPPEPGDTRLGDVPVIGTGAGHDAGILANDGIRSAMLFVRNPTGVSHSPDEWASADDCLDGIAALADVVTDLAGAGA